MFKKEDGAAMETVIAAGVKVEGDFVSPGNVRIEGIVKGTVRTDGDLYVAETAKIEADVKAANAMVAGEINGDLSVADKLDLSGTAKLNGNISAKIFTVEAGAVILGNCSINPEPVAVKNRGRSERAAEAESEA